jgi:hypothetical protein
MIVMGLLDQIINICRKNLSTDGSIKPNFSPQIQYGSDKIREDFEKTKKDFPVSRTKTNGKIIDYDKLIDEAVSSLPAEAYFIPAIGVTEPVCPYCKSLLSKMPGAKTKCKSCGNFIYVKKSPTDNQKILITETQVSELGKIWGHKNRISLNPERLENFKRDLTRYQNSGITKWQSLSCLGQDAYPIELELDRRTVKMGSDQEREMLKYLCDPRYRFGIAPVVDIPRDSEFE